ncbi:hypothetical protein BHE74_00056131 [Ensete ventricosum]|nr:hypothetical protein BHE74_00056131 [Ensete ventricosum]
MCVSLSVSVGHGSTNSARDCTSGSSSSGLYLGLLLLWSMPLAPPPWVCASCSFSSSPFAGVMHKSTVGVGVFDMRTIGVAQKCGVSSFIYERVSLASTVVAIESSRCHLDPILRQLSWRRIFTPPWTAKLDLSELG